MVVVFHSYHIQVINLKKLSKVPNQIIQSSEGDEQRKLFDWADIASNLLKYEGLDLMFHIPNEGKRSRYSGGKLKSEGLKRGVVDVCLPVPRGKYHGLFFEMKYNNNKLTYEQKKFLRGVKAQGYATWVCYSAEEAIELITQYYKLPKEVKYE